MSEQCTLYLIRHGETNWNLEKRAQGVSDIPLNQMGKIQAKNLAKKLQRIMFSKIYTSPLTRALETAEIMAKSLGNVIVEMDNFAELDQGMLEGMKFNEMNEKFPEFFIKWRAAPGEVRMPGGETLGELQTRAWNGIEKIHSSHTREENPVLIVSHNLTIISILSRILKVNLNHFRTFRQHNASVNIIEKDSNRGWSVVTMNDISHL